MRCHSPSLVDRPGARSRYNAWMPDGPLDPRWPKLFALSVHEFRSPLTVVSGYIRMLLKDRAGPLTDPQKKLLEETAKSCARLSELLSEASEVAHLDDGRLSLTRQRIDLWTALREAVETLPPLPDRDVAVRLDLQPGSSPIDADAPRLTRALAAIVAGLRREVVTDEPLIVRARHRRDGDRAHYEITIGEPATIEEFDGHPDANLPPFDEWRGGCGLSLPLARRVLNAHGGQLLSTPDGRKTAALIRLPAGS